MTRRTYHYDPAVGRMVEGPGPRRTDGSGDGWRFSDRTYSGKPFKASDGTVIDSRKKHRDYMKRNSLTTMDDYKGEWAQAQARREDVFAGRNDKPERIEAIRRAVEQHRGS